MPCAVGLDGFAFLGSWGGGAQCPVLASASSTSTIQQRPRSIGTAAVYSGTTAEHLAAIRYATPAFTGNVLFAGIQRCVPSSGAPSGLAIWDVTDPANPTELGFLPTGRGSRGVHEFTVRQRGDRWFAYLAVSNSEASSDGRGDLRIVDVTDPAPAARSRRLGRAARRGPASRHRRPVRTRLPRLGAAGVSAQRRAQP